MCGRRWCLPNDLCHKWHEFVEGSIVGKRGGIYDAVFAEAARYTRTKVHFLCGVPDIAAAGLKRGRD